MFRSAAGVNVLLNQTKYRGMQKRAAFDVESWRAFISEKIVPMRDEAAALLNFWAFLKASKGGTCRKC